MNLLEDHTRWMKIYSDLKSDASRTVLVIISIAVGVFAVGMITNAYILLIEGATVNYVPSNPASAFLITATFDDFDDELVYTVQKIPEIKDVEGRRYVRGKINIQGNWYSMELAGLDFSHNQVNILEETSGQFPPDERQVVLDQSCMAMLDIHTGEMVEIEMPDGSRYRLPVAGMVRDVNANPSFNSNSVNAYVNMDTMVWLGETASYNRLLFTTSDMPGDKAHVQEVTAKVRSKIEGSGRAVFSTVIYKQPGENPISFVLDAILIVLGTLALAALILSGFLVYNTVSALLLGQVRNIGVMKAIGADERDLTVMYLVYVAILGFLAFTFAVSAAALAANAFAGFVAHPSKLDIKLPDFHIPFFVILLELITSLIVPLLASLPAIFKGTGITIREAINSYGLGDSPSGDGILDRFLTGARQVSGPTLLSFGSMLMHKKRMFLTLGTLIIGGAMFVGVFSVRASSYTTVDEMEEEYRFDVEISFERNYRIEKIAPLAMQVPGVLAVEGWGVVNGSIVWQDGREGNSVQVMALPSGSDLTQPKMVEGRWLYPEEENGIILGSDLYEEDPSLEIGDDINIKINGRQRSFTIVGIYQTIGPFPVHRVYTNYPYISSLVNKFDEVQRIQIVTEEHDAAYQEDMAELVEAQFQKAGIRVSQATTGNELRGVRREQFSLIVAVLLMMVLLITLVGGLGLAGTMGMNVVERRREIGVMRAIGASDRAVLKVVMLEGFFIACVSWSLSILFAGPVGRGLSYAVGVSIFGSPLSYVYSVSGAIIWLAVILLVSGIASYMPARYASRLTVRDVLAYE